MCFPLLDNVILMRWTVLLWSILRTIWPSHIRVIKEVSSAQLYLMCLTLCQLCLFHSITLQVVLSLDSDWNHMLISFSWWLNEADSDTASALVHLSWDNHLKENSMWLSPPLVLKNHTVEKRSDKCVRGDSQSCVDKYVYVIHGGLTLGFPRTTVRNDQWSVTACISYTTADHTLVNCCIKVTWNFSRP